ncbi:TrbG/VirB9 family P-type conjugative transfer protein [Caulobacter hibisci]|uniref:TrbG/VirB9 family P-type conjugative transfer protein n=1 Tax=Caulobacter hibisci TaxID=2035993 RepID=A0ABS0SUJ7_9CAUL|nr:TrbG/VirB9 family P-type conjugative transfer protein [Caulobacter hibisci]
MKRSLLALSLALGVAAPALAQTVAPAVVHAAADPHIRTFAYDPDRVQRLTGVMGFQTMIEFGPDERIENVSIGDALGWQVTPNKRATLLFLKPVDRAPATNMTVVTDRRRYVFELSVAPAKASTADAAYVVRFRYPPVAVEAPPPPAKPAAPIAHNSAYSVQGATGLAPSRIFDDGRATYFAWPQQADLPAIFVVGADGAEGLANAVVKDGYLAVDRIAPRFVLRSDKASATIVNAGWTAPSAEIAR